MNIIKYPYILAIVPFVAIIVAAYFMDVFPKTSIITRILDGLAEKDLPDLMIKAGMTKTTVKSYQMLRFGAVIAVLCVILTFDRGDLKETIIKCAILAVVIYKLLYFYLVLKEKNRIAKLNEELPYCMKAISYLCYLYPVNNAFEKAIDYVPEVFRSDIEILVKDIDNDPLSFQPYLNWINRYEDKLDNLKFNLRELYRMSESSSKEQETMLANLNASISNETRRVRLAKNNSINSAIAWLGMIPVFLLALMLMVLLVVIIDFI